MYTCTICTQYTSGTKMGERHDDEGLASATLGLGFFLVHTIIVR